MANRNYKNGREFEYRVKKKLEQDGFVVFRMAGSHSQADLIAFKAHSWPRVAASYTEIRFVQCKGGGAGMSRAERASFHEFARSIGAEAWVALSGLRLEPAVVRGVAA